MSRPEHIGPVEVWICRHCRNPQPAPQSPCASCGRTAAVELDPWVDRVIGGRYRLLRRIAIGGFGMVFAAEDQQAPHRLVALKVPRDDRPRLAEASAQFAAEARVALHIDSQRIIKVHALGMENDEIPYLVMELVRGHTLTRVMREEGPMPLSRILHIADEVATAIIEAHEHGVVHGDLTPSNLILQDDGNIKVIDFGVSSFASDRQSVSAGTPGYMAPERTSAGPVDVRSDIYSLGAILAEMIGCGSWTSESALRELLELCETMMSPNPDERPDSMQRVRDRLTEIGAAIDVDNTGLWLRGRQSGIRALLVESWSDCTTNLMVTSVA